MKKPLLTESRSKGGRPRKYTEPSRPVTLTLPDRTLEQLTRIDADRGKAIVKAVDSVLSGSKASSAPVDIVKISPTMGLIVVGPCKALRRIPWLSLIEIAPARYLLSVPSGTPVDALEVAVGDLIDDPRTADADEKKLLLALMEKIRTLRRSQRVTKGELLFIAAEH